MREGYSIDLQVATVLGGLGFSREDFDRPADTFSGGWQMRIALAKLLLGRPGLLLLDEPTNHLDLEARNWLESYLREYPHAVILVSHDRFFLDTVVTKIADLNLRTITDYHGNYSDYLVERDARIERLRAAKKEQDEEVARVKMFVDRFRYQATKASQVQSRIKMLEKVVPIEVPPERRKVHFTFPAAPKSGRTVLEMKHVHKAYGPIAVFNALGLHIERGDRIALVGPNGAGKSTLMRMLSGEESPDQGERVWDTRSSASTSRRTKRPGSIRPRPSTRRCRRDRRCTWSPRFETSSAGSSFRATTSTRSAACCRAVSARGSPSRACCSGRRTCCCSTSRPITSISTRRTCCSTRWWTTAAR